MKETIFTKIIKGEIPAEKIYEDDKMVAILDIKPKNLGHTLVIPKEVYENIFDTPEEILCNLISKTKLIAHAVKKGLSANGVNLWINNGKEAGQEIDHIHIHIVPRFAGDDIKGHKSYKDGEMKEIGEKIRKAF